MAESCCQLVGGTDMSGNLKGGIHCRSVRETGCPSVTTAVDLFASYSSPRSYLKTTGTTGSCVCVICCYLVRCAREFVCVFVYVCLLVCSVFTGLHYLLIYSASVFTVVANWCHERFNFPWEVFVIDTIRSNVADAK